MNKTVIICILMCLTFTLSAEAASIPKTMFPIPAKRSQDKQAIQAAQPYLKLSPEKYLSLVPTESPAPVLVETSKGNSSFNGTICPFCGKTGNWFKYDLVNDPDHVYCAQTTKDILSFPTSGKDTFTDYNNKQYQRDFFVSEHIKPIPPYNGPVKVYPQNYVARERIQALIGTYKGGALMPLAKAYYATGDEKYAVRAIAIMEGFANVLSGYPWTMHSAMVPCPKEELLACAKKHDSGYHGWLGPARLGAAQSNFRNPEEAMYFTNFCNAYMMLEGSTSWHGKREYVLDKLIREGSIHFQAYGAKQCVGNAIGMYAPALHVLGIVLQDSYFYDGFIKIMDDFLYNENYHDGISTEGSIAYSGMVNGMWNQFEQAKLTSNEEYMQSHPFLNIAGKTTKRGAMLRGGTANYGDNHPSQYIISKDTPKDLVPGEEFGGFGVSIVRAGAADQRLELVFMHDRCTGHSHDDMLGMQLFYRGIPLLEHIGDTRNTKDMNETVPDYENFMKLKYPAPFVTKDERPRGFSLQDMTTGLTKNKLIIDNYWENNSWYHAYRGGYGYAPKLAFGNLIARTGCSPELPFQYVEAEGKDQNAKAYQEIHLFKRAFAVVTRPDGRPYIVDFFAVDGGHRHTLLFHSRGKEIYSTLGKGKDYSHLEDLPGIPDDNFGDEIANYTTPSSNLLFPGKVLNNVNYGADVRNAWRHAWEFDYAAWASKTNPPAKNLIVKPHILSIYGFIQNSNSKALRADGHFPQTIAETFNGQRREYRFQFNNAIHYAGLMGQSRGIMNDCYVQCFECYAKDEAPTFKSIRSLNNDDKGYMRRAIEISFEDGTKDIVFWQPYQTESSWDAQLFSSDARCGIIRVNQQGQVIYSSITGGTHLLWHKKQVLQGKGILSARIAKIEGDISGHPEKSILVLKGANDWPAGPELKGHTIIAAYNRGLRREAYTVDYIEHQGELTYVHLEKSPFFRDLNGEVFSVKNQRRMNQFNGTETAKGGNNTRYLHGSKLVFPTLNKSYFLDNCGTGNNYSYTYTTSEDVNLEMEGVKPGIPFYIEPDWQDAIVEIATTATMERKSSPSKKAEQQPLSPNAKIRPGFVVNPYDDTLWCATGKNIQLYPKATLYGWNTSENLNITNGKNDVLSFNGNGNAGVYVQAAPGYNGICFDIDSASPLGSGYYAISFNLSSMGASIFGMVHNILPGIYCIPLRRQAEKLDNKYMRIDVHNGNVIFHSIKMLKELPCSCTLGGKDIKPGDELCFTFTLAKPAQALECRLFQCYTMPELQLKNQDKRLYATAVPNTNNKQWQIKCRYDGFANRLAGKNNTRLAQNEMLIEATVDYGDDTATYLLFNDQNINNLNP